MTCYDKAQSGTLAINGQYGGSNAYWPKSEDHVRQVLHTHGPPQASGAFLEIDDIGAFLERQDVFGANANDWNQIPPAGLSSSA